MQYLLTREEYERLIDKSLLKEKNLALNEARKLIVSILGIDCPADNINYTQMRPCYSCPIHNDLDRASSKKLCPGWRDLPK